MWNEKDCAWSTSKVRSVQVADGNLSFSVTGLGSFAVVYDRCAMLPYHAWHIRPAAGEDGNVALLSIDVGMDDMPLEFEIGPGHVTLKGPMLRPLVPLLGVTHQPLELLRALQNLGVFLLPTAADAPRVDVELKDLAVEQAMCDGIAMLAGSHIIASSKWTQYVGVRQQAHLFELRLTNRSRAAERVLACSIHPVHLFLHGYVIACLGSAGCIQLGTSYMHLCVRACRLRSASAD